MKRNIIRQIYLYAVSIISLFLVVFALGQIVNIGLKTWVFPKADYAYSQKCDEAGIVYYGNEARPAVAPDAKPTEVPALSDEQKAANKSRCEKDLADTRAADKQRELVSALSMLIVAVPVLAFHFRIVQKERKEEREDVAEAKA